MPCVFETDDHKLFRKTTRENSIKNHYPLSPVTVSTLLSLFAPIMKVCDGLQNDPDSLTLEHIEEAAKSMGGMDGGLNHKLLPYLYSLIDSNELPEFKIARIMSNAIELWKAEDLQGLKDLQKYINSSASLGFWEHAAIINVVSEYRYSLGEERPKGFLG